MAHDHAHHHDGDANSYFIQQLVTIAICGALGGVMVMLYATKRVNFLFGDNNEVQHIRVLLGGAGLLAVVFIRAIYVWFAVGQPKTHSHDHSDCGHSHNDCGHDHSHDHAHDHSHDHAHDHSHDHAHDHSHDHAHDHAHEHHHEHAEGHHHHEHAEGLQVAAPTGVGSLSLATVSAAVHEEQAHTHDHDHTHSHDHDDHDHGWAPWRFMLLLLPVILFLLGLPSQGLTKGFEVKIDSETLDQLGDKAKGGDAGGEAIEMRFSTLEQASLNANMRDGFEGKMVKLTGMYVGTDSQRFTLQRFKLNCCAADAIPLGAVIMVNPGDANKWKLDPGQYQGKWVSVTGRVHFLYRRASNDWLTAVFLYPTEKKDLSKLVEVVPPDPHPYVD